MSELRLSKGEKVTFAGDSITDAGRWGGPRYGRGYVLATVELLQARYPALGLEFENVGIGGWTTRNLREVWDEWVIAKRPDWVTIMIGINDCNLALMGHELGVNVDEYEQFYREIVEKTAAIGAKIVLLDSFYICRPDEATDEQRPTIEKLPEYLDVVHRLVKEFDTLHVPTHDLYQEQLQYRPAEDFCPEPVHPTESGHLVIAHGLLQALGW